MKTILKIAHRGAKGFEPENTLMAFRKALALNVDGIELDVHLSSDGVLMVIHDETIDRTTSKKGFVNEYTSSELKELGIPTLIEVLDLVNCYCFVNIELKGRGTASTVVDVLNQYLAQRNWEYSDFLLSSFNWKMLEEVYGLNPKIRIGVLTETAIDEAVAFAKKVKAFSIHPEYLLLSKENVALMQEYGWAVYAWTVNALQDIQKIKSFGVNGIISDFPDRI